MINIATRLTAVLLLLGLKGIALAHPEAPTEASEAYANNTEAFEVGPEDAAVHCILVHGFAGSPLDFSDLPDRLAEAGMRVSALRLPHHGTRSSVLAQASSNELIEYVENTVAESNENYETTVLMGFSMGGSIAAIVAARANVDRLVLIAPFFEVTHRWYFGLRAETWNATLGVIIPYLPKTSLSVQVNRREAVPHLFSNSWLSTAAVDTLIELGRGAAQEGTLEAIEADTLVLHSPKDKAACERASYRNFQRFTSENHQYIEMPERNNHHLLSDWDRELAYEHILEFVLGR